MKQSSSDPVKTEETMDWETGAQSSEEQHKEGISDATDMPSAGLELLLIYQITNNLFY